jgi:Uma2 family endonuclease
MPLIIFCLSREWGWWKSIQHWLGKYALESCNGRLFSKPFGAFMPIYTAASSGSDARLANALHRFLITNNIEGEVHHPREPIYTHGTYLEPDMMYVSHELRARMGVRRTSADIVFAYLSKGTATYDRTTKADTYLALGVRELWLVDPDTVTIEVRHALAASGSNEFPRWENLVSTAGQRAESRVLAGWRVAVDEVFAGLV